MDEYDEVGAATPEEEMQPSVEELDPNEELPLFANKENREINEEVKLKTRRLDVVSARVKEDVERVAIMEEHLKNVQQELAHTQQLVDAKRREVETEDHLKQLAEREVGRVRSDISKLHAVKEEVLDKLNQVQNAIFKGNDKMDRFKIHMNWNQEELEQWALAAKQKEEDNLAIQKYTRADEAKIKELSLQIEKLSHITHEKKVALENEVTETQAKQIELDKTAEEFRNLHRERQNLVKQWQDALESMKRRDHDIEQAGEEFVTVKKELAKVQEFLEEEKARLDSQEQDNAELESKAAMSDRILQKRRDEAVGARERFQDFVAEVELLKIELSKAAADAALKRSANQNELSRLEAAKGKLEHVRKRYQAVKRRLAVEKGEMSSKELVAKGAEEKLKEREQEMKAVEQQLAALKEQMFKQSQELFQLRQEEANLIAEIAGAQAASKNLSGKVAKLDSQSLRQQELIYTAEFQIQQLERKVARASGVRSDEEKHALNKRIAEVQKDLDAVTEQHKMLQTQVKKLRDELRRTKRNASETTTERKRIEGKIAELNLENNSAESSLRAVIKEKEDLMVQHDVMKLEVKRLRDQLSGRADEVFGLENRKYQLAMSMEERRKEILVHSEVQRARVKTAEEERHKVALEAKERGLKVDKLKLKYETVCKGSNVGENGEERSQAYYVIAAAQKREELQREGDELDAKIRKAEREIRALVNTLQHLNTRNTAYRASFHRADANSKEAREMRYIEEQAKASSDALFKKRKELSRLNVDLDEDQRRLRQIREQSEQVERHITHLRSAHDQVRTELSEQAVSVDELRRAVQAASEVHRGTLGLALDEESTHEKAFRAEALTETCNNVLFTLGQLSKEFPEMQVTLHSSLQRVALSIPAQPPSRAAGDSRGQPRPPESSFED